MSRTLPLGWADVIAPSVANALTNRPSIGYDGRRILFGDIHNHSGESILQHELRQTGVLDSGCGVGSRDAMFRYARDIALLDFFCLSEHDWQMNATDWCNLNRLTDDYHQPNSGFLTLHGFEWTSSSYGHRNVYFRDRPGEMFRAGRGDEVNVVRDGLPTPRDLWSHLDEAGAPAITVPHHMSAKQFPLSLEHFHSPEYDRVAEIYSSWGDSLEQDEFNHYTGWIRELAFIRAIRAGYEVGFVGSSDSHDGHPGNAQGLHSHRQLYHFLGSGLVGALVEDVSRVAIFDAMRGRRTYAATCEGIAIDTSLDGHPMGSVVQMAELTARPIIRVRARSFLPFTHVAIYKNGALAESLDAGLQGDLDLKWRVLGHDRTESANYFVKLVRADGERAWTSPTWLMRA